jgi:hypothetical protein
MLPRLGVKKLVVPSGKVLLLGMNREIVGRGKVAGAKDGDVGDRVFSPATKARPLSWRVPARMTKDAFRAAFQFAYESYRDPTRRRFARPSAGAKLRVWTKLSSRCRLKCGEAARSW